MPQDTIDWLMFQNLILVHWNHISQCLEPLVRGKWNLFQCTK